MNERPDQPPPSALHVRPGVSVDPDRVTKPQAKRRELTADEHIEGVLAKDRVVIAQTLTLIESAHPEHREKAEEVLRRLMPHAGGAVRLGISGAPGAGKSTFIETLGKMLIEGGHRVAVLAVDPSSEISGGSILGDKTRMEHLSRSPEALVRPSPSGAHLGGVARRTREAIFICEAGGHDVIIVETVGVGQSETQVASMVDFFLLLLQPGAGDELQGIKRGIIELADAVAVNKADGDHAAHAKVTRAQFESALHLMRPATEGWAPPALTCSALTGDGIEAVWEQVTAHRAALEANGQLEAKRRRQAEGWLHQMIEDLLMDRFAAHPGVKAQLDEIRREVLEGAMSPTQAAHRLVDLAMGG